MQLDQGNSEYFQVNSPFELMTTDQNTCTDDTEDAEIKNILKNRIKNGGEEQFQNL